MAIVAALFMAVFGRLLGRWRGALVAAIGILLYVLLVGTESSAVSAAIMGGLSIFAVQLGRRPEGMNSLVITGRGTFLGNLLFPVVCGLGFRGK
jgi:predicted membrane metal-binding protein